MVRAPALPPPVGLDRCHAVLAYEGPGRELVARLKYHNARDGLRWLAVAMATTVAGSAASEVQPVITWIPTSPQRRRQRGFDQAELLARRIALELRFPCRWLLRRDSGPPQTGRSAPERRVGPVFATVETAMPASVILVDDVLTTGATMEAAAKALRGAGVDRVEGLVAARTPLKRGPTRSVTNGDDDQHGGPGAGAR
jgi:predicted amidophosphoribosyltransferase